MDPSILRRREAIALLAAIAVAWGTSWPVIKAILQDLPPMWAMGLRSAIGAATLFAISAFAEISFFRNVAMSQSSLTLGCSTWLCLLDWLLSGYSSFRQDAR